MEIGGSAVEAFKEIAVARFPPLQATLISSRIWI